MDEHKFPLDLDADLRKEVKLEVERATVGRELSEIKKRIYPMVRWLLVVLFLHGLGAAIFGTFRAAVSFAASSTFVLLVALFVNSKRSQGIYWVWREMVNSRKQARSWDNVAGGYKKLIKREDQARDR
jgi:hypothetical protein